MVLEAVAHDNEALAEFNMRWQDKYNSDFKIWKSLLKSEMKELDFETSAKATDKGKGLTELPGESGSSGFQGAMDRVHARLRKLSCWEEWTSEEQSMAMEATQVFLLRHMRKFDIDLVASKAVDEVDSRLHALCLALCCSIQLENWKFDKTVKQAISSDGGKFSELCSSAEHLKSLDFRSRDKNCDPLYIVSVFKGLCKAIVSFLEAQNVEASMDAQIDAALYAIVQTAPSRLYYHTQAVHLYLWRPWADHHEAQFAVMLLTSVVSALYTVNTEHFAMEEHLFLGMMASHGFDPETFQPRPRGTELPEPFGRGPPLGRAALGASGDVPARGAGSRAAAGALPSTGATSTAERSPGAREAGAPSASPKAVLSGTSLTRQQRARVAALERRGEALVRHRGLAVALAKEYPYMLVDADAIFLKDVPHLLEEYRRVVVQYESLKAGVAETPDGQWT